MLFCHLCSLRKPCKSKSAAHSHVRFGSCRGHVRMGCLSYGIWTLQKSCMRLCYCPASGQGQEWDVFLHNFCRKSCKNTPHSCMAFADSKRHVKVCLIFIFRGFRGHQEHGPFTQLLESPEMAAHPILLKLLQPLKIV